MKSLVWFRNDLRMDDNPALREACKVSEEVHAIYIYSQHQNKEHIRKPHNNSVSLHL